MRAPGLGTLALLCLGGATVAFALSNRLSDPASSLLLAYAVLPLGVASLVVGAVGVVTGFVRRSPATLGASLLALAIPALAVAWFVWALAQFD